MEVYRQYRAFQRQYAHSGPEGPQVESEPESEKRASLDSGIVAQAGLSRSRLSSQPEGRGRIDPRGEEDPTRRPEEAIGEATVPGPDADAGASTAASTVVDPEADPTAPIPLASGMMNEKLESGGGGRVYVAFEKDGSDDPHNWSMGYKVWLMIQLSFLTISLTFASAASSSAALGAQEEFGAGDIAGVATTGMFVLGMGLGSMPWAPLSELYGRMPIYLCNIVGATLFAVGCALSPNMPCLIILRLIAGFVAAGPLANAGGSLNDIGNPVFRTIGLPLFTSAGFVGPLTGPIIGSFVNQALGWRWVYWVCAIWHAAALAMVVLFMPETLGPALLKYKAIAWRNTSGDGKWKAGIEDEKLWNATVRSLKRPFIMLANEPILILFSVYLTVVYTCLYGCFNAYDYVFARKGLSPTEIGLVFIPVQIGFFLLFGLTFWHFTRYRKLYYDALGGKSRRGIFEGKVEPEERLIPLMISAILFPIGLFWFAWTSAPSISIWVTMMSGIPFGFGLLAIFQASYQYLMDAYGPFAASALAGATLTRYGISGIVVLAYPSMYDRLGAGWAGSIFGILGVLLLPVPFCFYYYGRRIRAACKFTVRD